MSCAHTAVFNAATKMEARPGAGGVWVEAAPQPLPHSLQSQQSLCQPLPLPLPRPLAFPEKPRP